MFSENFDYVTYGVFAINNSTVVDKATSYYDYIIKKAIHIKINSPPLWDRTDCGPGFDPQSGQVFWVRFFRGFFLTRKTNVG